MRNAKGGILSHFLAIGTGTIINMFLGFITTPIITRLVDTTEYGQFSMFSTYSGIALMVLCCGLDQSLVRFFYEEDDVSYKRSLLRFCILIPTAATLITSAVVLLASAAGLHLKFNTLILAFLCLHVLVSIWDRISALGLRLSYNSKRYAACNVLRRLIDVVIVIGAVLLLKSHYLIIMIVGSTTALIVTSLFAINSSKDIWHFRGAARFEKKDELLKYGLPLVLSMGLSTLFQALDRLAIDKYCDYSAVGIYASGQTIIAIFAIVQTTFNAIWVPMQVEHYTKNPEEKGFFQKGNQYITIIMFFMGLSLIAFKEIVIFLLGPKYRLASTFIPFLALEPMMYTISETTHAGIGKSKKSYYGIIVSGISCLVNFTGNTLLVPRIGPTGAAISTGISYIVFFALRTAFSNKYFYVDYKLGKFSLMTGITLVYIFLMTFRSNWTVALIGYAVCMSALLLLYRDSVKNLIADAIRQFRPDDSPA